MTRASTRTGLTALEFPFTLSSSNNGLRLKRPSLATTALASLAVGDYLPIEGSSWEALTLMSLVDELTSALDAAYNVIYGSGASFEVSVSDYYMTITNNSPNGIEVRFGHADSTLKGRIGFGDQNSDVLIAGSGGSITANFRLSNVWAPLFFVGRDTREDAGYLTIKSETMDLRPQYTSWTDQLKFRKIRWDNVPAAFVVENRALNQDFCDSCGLVAGDPNCFLQRWLDYITDGDGPFPGRCWIRNRIGNGTAFEHIGPYWVDIPSDCLSNVTKERWGDSSIECFIIDLSFKLQESNG